MNRAVAFLGGMLLAGCVSVPADRPRDNTETVAHHEPVNPEPPNPPATPWPPWCGEEGLPECGVTVRGVFYTWDDIQ